jgi:hypothetical protein
LTAHGLGPEETAASLAASGDTTPAASRGEPVCKTGS